MCFEVPTILWLKGKKKNSRVTNAPHPGSDAFITENRTSCSMLVKTNVKLRLKQLSMVGLSISKNGFITAYQFLSFEN